MLLLLPHTHAHSPFSLLTFSLFAIFFSSSAGSIPLPLLTGESHSKHGDFKVGNFIPLSPIPPSPLPSTGLACYSGNGRGYQGIVSVTESGRRCQFWNVSSPHQHLLAYESYPELAGGHNFCRNPGGRGQRPWCFTTDRDTRWEYCDIPECGERGREGTGGFVPVTCRLMADLVLALTSDVV